MNDHCAQDEEKTMAHSAVSQVHTKERMNREFHLNVHIGTYRMENIILDLGYDVNVIPR